MIGHRLIESDIDCKKCINCKEDIEDCEECTGCKWAQYPFWWTLERVQNEGIVLVDKFKAK